MDTAIDKEDIGSMGRFYRLKRVVFLHKKSQIERAGNQLANKISVNISINIGRMVKKTNDDICMI